MRHLIQSKAREYIGTPFHHHGRLKGVGIDCVGLVICVGNELGFPTHDIQYGPEMTGDILIKELPKLLNVVDAIEVGSLIAFWIRSPRDPVHVGIRSDYGIIHVVHHTRQVVEHRLTEAWTKRIAAAYDYRGVV